MIKYPNDRSIPTKTRYPQMLELLERNWRIEQDFDTYISQCEELNRILETIRINGGIKRIRYFCKKCSSYHLSYYSRVTVSSIIYTLVRYKLLDPVISKKLLYQRKKFRSKQNLNLEGLSDSDNC